MAPEQEAHTRAFYDHENDEPRRRRPVAADWGVNEDIFDRMPSRFGRAERRPQHQEIVLVRDEGETGVAVVQHDARDEYARAAAAERVRGDVARGDAGHGGDARRGGDVARVRGDVAGRGESVARVRGDVTGRGESVARARGGAAEGTARVREDGAARVSARTETSARARTRDDGELDPRAAARAMMSWGEDLDEAPMVPGESRTIVLSRDEQPSLDELYANETPLRQTGEFESLTPDTQERRTIKISGHPDRLPAPRTQRPPRTAVERIAHRPDRIVGYAVALGFLLVLIAVLTTGQ